MRGSPPRSTTRCGSSRPPSRSTAARPLRPPDTPPTSRSGARRDAGAVRGILAPARAELRERGSRFLAHLLPAAGMPDAERLAGEVAAAFRDATHHVRAVRVIAAAGGFLEVAHDAGEPAGTAGRPVLDALVGARLVGVVLVVSRWFGGVNLGRGGLARAYGGAARAAIAAAQLVQLVSWTRVAVWTPFADAGGVAAAARGSGGRIVATSPGEEYRVELRVPLERLDELDRLLATLTSGRARTERGATALEPG